MFQKSLIFIGILGFITFVGLSVVAQTPEPPRREGHRVFSWSFDGGSYLGVETAEVNRANFAKFGLRDVRGVAVEKVLEGSPAQSAGLHAGDVIVRFNGQEVSSSRMLTRLINEIDPDHTARITVIRGGSERELNVTVGKRPTPKWDDSTFNLSFPENFPNIEIPHIQLPRMPVMPKVDINPRIDIPNLPNWNGEDFNFHFGPSRQIGVSLVRMTKQLSDSFGVTGGAMVSEVRENSPAAKAGLKAGDIIIEVEGKAVTGDGDLIRAINEKKDGDITLTLVRGGNRQTVKVTPEEFKGGGDFRFFFEGPDAPKTPGSMNLVKPNKLPAPMPLNQLMVPGRVI